MPLRLIFMGTPDFAVPTLLELVAHGHEVVAVYTRAPAPAKRGLKQQDSPVAREADRRGIPVLAPPTLSVPVVDGRLQLGTWQSIALLDPNRDNPTRTVRLSFLPA